MSRFRFFTCDSCCLTLLNLGAIVNDVSLDMVYRDKEMFSIDDVDFSRLVEPVFSFPSGKVRGIIVRGVWDSSGGGTGLLA